MAKLTKDQKRQIERALYHAERAFKYVMRPDIAVAKIDRQATTTLHYVRQDGAALYPVAKDIGSDLCGLSDAIKEMQGLLS